MANTGIMHWKVGEGRVACNTRRAIMYLPWEAFLNDEKPCRRCMAKANEAIARQEKKAREAGL